jgi:hypothetical protein
MRQMKITTDELRRASNALFDYLDRTEQREFEIDEDFYWVVAEEERYAPYVEPKTWLMGQLSDDVGEIKRIANGSGVPVGRALVWLAAVLRRVGETSRA